MSNHNGNRIQSHFQQTDESDLSDQLILEHQIATRTSRLQRTHNQYIQNLNAKLLWK